jgi:hypothetical protein
VLNTVFLALAAILENKLARGLPAMLPDGVSLHFQQQNGKRKRA